MPDGYERRSGDDYARALADLLPVGEAWPRDPASVLMQLVSGLGQTWGVVDGRAADLFEVETDPRFTDELLGDWEVAFGLPDTCGPAPTTIAARRAALLTKMTAIGGQSRAYFIGLAAALGYSIQILEWSPFQAGISRCGDTRPTAGEVRWFRCGVGHAGTDAHLTVPTTLRYVGPARWRVGPPTQRAWWCVLVAGRTFAPFRAGNGDVATGRQSHVGGDPLLAITPPFRWFRAGVGGGQAGIDHHLDVDVAEDLECVLRRFAPAHTVLTFDYTGRPLNTL